MVPNVRQKRQPVSQGFSREVGGAVSPHIVTTCSLTRHGPRVGEASYGARLVQPSVASWPTYFRRRSLTFSHASAAFSQRPPRIWTCQLEGKSLGFLGCIPSGMCACEDWPAAGDQVWTCAWHHSMQPSCSSSSLCTAHQKRLRFHQARGHSSAGQGSHVQAVA
eukprot:365019-Chlamydomonas_euryale.AAC.5